MERGKIKELVSQMTLDEKVNFTAGIDFWFVSGLERLGIPSSMVADGPHGLRKQVGETDMLGLNDSIVSVCFPAGCAVAASFDPALVYANGVELGKICQAEDVSVILGPAMNIKRDPRCGRNFEYYSEDPYLSAKMGMGAVKGIQSQNVGACPKHFLANNQEHYRMTSNSVIDERTLREIYLNSFEEMVKESKPWTIMNSYNRINGSYASEHKEALNDILRDEWGFDGYVMTDWGACADPVKSVEAGMDLCMPGPANGNKEQIKDAVINGRLSVEILDRVVERILNIVFRYAENKTGKSYDFEAGHAQARIAAEGSAVLLKNANRALPLNNNEKVVFIGEYAKNPRYQGGGSSHIHPYRVVGALEAASDKEIVYCQGYLEAQNNKAADEKLLEEAVAAAKTADKVVIFAGLPESFESEGLDRKDIDMPQNQNALIRAVADVQPNTIVVLHNGSPVAMPWRDSVAAIMEMYLGGEAVGEATVNLLYGRCNPCGHLPETFPLRIEDTPAYPYYGVERDDVIYREGVMVGYRFYETVKREVAFPFGTGLSYSDFAYTNLTVDKSEIEDTDTVKVSVDVTNTSSISGKAVVQLYVAAPVSRVVRPVRELRGFEKVELTAGETKTVVFELNKRAFAYWNVNIHDWYVPSGRYEIQIGTSAHDIVAAAFVKIHCTAADKPFFTVNTPLGDIMAHPVGAQVFKQILDAMGNNIGTDGEEQEQSGGMLSQEAMDVSAAAMPPRALLSFVPELRIEQIQQMIDAINAAIG